MAVQAQYQSSILPLNRGEQDLTKEMEYTQAPTGYLDQSAVFLSNGGNGGNQRKRGRESIFSLQQLNSAPSPAFVTLAQLQAHPPPLVSTGLRLAVEDQNQSQDQSTLIISQELAAKINEQHEEIDQLLVAQGEQLRRAVAGRRRGHYRALLAAAEDLTARRMREKEAEVDRASNRAAELERRLARIRAESTAWKAKAMADQAAAAALHAQLQQAAAVRLSGEEAGETPADDAESAHVDPVRSGPVRVCRSCLGRPASVVMLPCRHLCLCAACDVAAEACPVCCCLRTGSVQVFLS